MNTMDRMAVDAGSCIAKGFFLLAALISLGLGYLVARWTGVIIVAALLLLWYTSARKRAQPNSQY